MNFLLTGAKNDLSLWVSKSLIVNRVLSSGLSLAKNILTSSEIPVIFGIACL